MPVNQIDGISIKQVLWDSDSEVSGITIYNDGTRGYWTEAYAPTLYVTPTGEKRWEETFIAEDDEMSPHHRLGMWMGDKYHWDESNDRDMTREEQIEYYTVRDGMTKQEAEEYLDEE